MSKINFVYYPNIKINKNKTEVYVPESAIGFYLRGKNFRTGFSGSNLTCRINNIILKAKYHNSTSFYCELDNKIHANEKKHSFPVFVSLNGQSFVPPIDEDTHIVTFFKITKIYPDSGSVTSHTKVNKFLILFINFFFILSKFFFI